MSVIKKASRFSKKERLNPCCNGIYSMSQRKHSQQQACCLRLNPCCNGIYSMRIFENTYNNSTIVLILVVMEYTQ